MKLLPLRNKILEFMDIQAEKLHLIEWLARVTDIKIIQEIKSIEKETTKDLFKQYTDQDMIDRAEASLEDIEAGRTTRLADFKAEIENWKHSKSTK
jgi:enoyl reductase-like protein